MEYSVQRFIRNYPYVFSLFYVYIVFFRFLHDLDTVVSEGAAKRVASSRIIEDAATGVASSRVFEGERFACIELHLRVKG